MLTKSKSGAGLDRGNVLMFSHIPKTAGTTFNLLLRRYFGSTLLSARVREDSHWSTYRYVDLVKDLRVYPRVRCISGHGIKPFEDFQDLESRLVWFTFLRDPVARFISHYVHQQTGSHKRFHMPLPDWAIKFNRRNWCVRMMAGEEDVVAAQQILQEKISFVGFVEKFDLSVQMFCRAFALDDFDASYSQPRTVSRNPRLRDEIMASVERYTDIIEENTALDRRLFDFALNEIWPAQLLKYGSTGTSSSTGTYSRLAAAKNYLCWAVKDRIVYRPYVLIFG